MIQLHHVARLQQAYWLSSMSSSLLSWSYICLHVKSCTTWFHIRTWSFCHVFFFFHHSSLWKKQNSTNDKRYIITDRDQLTRPTLPPYSELLLRKLLTLKLNCYTRMKSRSFFFLCHYIYNVSDSLDILYVPSTVAPNLQLCFYLVKSNWNDKFVLFCSQVTFIIERIRLRGIRHFQIIICKSVTNSALLWICEVLCLF